jgi:hypothetical protein
MCVSPFLNLFIKKLTREGVVPIFAASVSTFGQIDLINDNRNLHQPKRQFSLCAGRCRLIS